MRWMIGVALPLLAAVTPVAAYAQAASIEGVGFDERLDEAPVVLPALPAATAAPQPVPLVIRLLADRAALEPAPGTYAFDTLDARVAAYEGRSGVRLWLDPRLGPPMRIRRAGRGSCARWRPAIADASRRT
ncbi:MAG: hypothetical protein R2712_20675 [Vicinamibacterales bacterium]